MLSTALSCAGLYGHCPCGPLSHCFAHHVLHHVALAARCPRCRAVQACTATGLLTLYLTVILLPPVFAPIAPALSSATVTVTHHLNYTLQPLSPLHPQHRQHTIDSAEPRRPVQPLNMSITVLLQICPPYPLHTHRQRAVHSAESRRPVQPLPCCPLSHC